MWQCNIPCYRMTRNDDWGAEGPGIATRSPAETVNVAVQCLCYRMARNDDWGTEGPVIVARSPAETVNVAAKCPCDRTARNDDWGTEGRHSGALIRGDCECASEMPPSIAWRATTTGGLKALASQRAHPRRR